MSYNYANVTLTQSQIKKLQPKKKTSNNDGVTITLKPSQMSGPNKLPLTKTQMIRFNAAKAASRGIRLKLSRAAVTHMEKTSGFFPFLIPALTALATGALGAAAGWGTKKVLDKATGGAIKTKVTKSTTKVATTKLSRKKRADQFAENLLADNPFADWD